MANHKGADASVNAIPAHTITLPTTGATLDFSSASISGMAVTPEGALVITFTPKSGLPTLTILNFRDLAAHNATIALKDGQSIDTHSLAQSLPVQDAAAHDKIEVTAPHAGEMKTVNMLPGHDYILQGDLAHAKVVDKGGALIITFADNGVLILAHFDDAMKAADAAHIINNNKTYDLASMQDQFHLAIPQNAQVAQNDNMDQIAQKLAGQEPAAGPNSTNTAGGVSSAGGYGFQSSIAPASLDGRAPIGPIGPTELAFGLPEGQIQRFVLPHTTPDAFPPSITVNNGLVNAIQSPDVIVKEDHSIFVPITATLDSHGSANQVLTVTVTGIDASWHITNADGVYDAAAGTWTITLPAGQNYVGGLTFAPPPNSDIDMSGLHATASSFDPAASKSATSTTTFNVITDAVADIPDLAAHAGGVESGHTIPLTIATAPSDKDGSEAIVKITVAGLPNGATLNHGTFDAATNTWTLTLAELNNLNLTLAKSVPGGHYNLVITSTSQEVHLSGQEVDFSDNIAHNTETLVLNVTPNHIPVITQPSAVTDQEHDIGTPAATLNGHITADYGIDGPGHVSANGGFSASGSELGGHLTSNGQAVTVTHTGTTYTGKTPGGDVVFTLTLQPNGDYTFTLLKPLDHADGAAPHDVINLNFGVTATDVDGDTAQTTLTVHIVDDAPVAHNDVNSFNSTIGAVETGNVITGLHGGAGAADTLSKDTPDTVSKVTFGGMTVNVPTAGAATIDGAHGTLVIKADGSYTYTIKNTGTGNTATDTFTYTLKDNDGDTSNATLKLQGHVTGTTTTIVVTDNPPGTPGNPGHPTPPDTGFPGNDGHVTANGGDVLVKEDHSVNVGLTVNSTGSGQQVTTVVLSGIDSSWGFVSHSGGTYNAAAGTWSITLAPGASLDGVFSFTPPANSDIDLNNLHVTATTNDPATGRTSNATSDFNIVVDAVADVPVLNVSNATDEAGHTVVLNIATHVTDTDGSESITKVTIAGVPAGATLNHGTFDAVTKTWTLAPADLATLSITVGKAVPTGTYHLTVTSYNAETHLSGKEVDLTDNTNHATKTLDLTVTPNGVPVITPPTALTDQEHDIGTPAATITGHITANYGVDAPGAISANGTFTAGGSLAGGHLTSDGEAVTVTRVGNTYTGKTPGGDVVFTLVVQANGDYSFTLNKPLDHADASAQHDVINLNFGVTATDADGDTATSTITVKIVDDAPVAHDDVNSFNATVGAVENGNVITGLHGGAGAADTLSKDTPDVVSKVTFGGTTVNVPSSGTATIEGAHGTLKIAADGSYTYTVKNTGAGSNASDTFTYTLKDADGDTSNATLKLDGHVTGTTTTIVVTDNPPGTPGNPGHPTPPDTGFPGNDGHVTANGGDVLVKEDHSVNVGVVVNSTGSGQQVTTVVLSGIDASWGFVSHSGGTYNAAAGTWTITLAPGASLDGVFSFTPPANSDIDLNNLHVTATTNDPATGRTSNATSDFNIVVDAVADVPVLQVTNAVDQAGHAAALNIATHVTDTDGSESITKVTIAGVPAGATLNHGTFAGGVWTLTPAELAGLTITVPKTVTAGTYHLTVTSFNAETMLSGKEVDLTDNTNHATKTLDLTVTANGIPVITPPDAISDQEHDIGTPAATINGHITANYGVDAPGAITANGTFTAGGSELGGHLTSNGQTVTVTHTGTTYTGKTPGGDVVFTLVVQPNGDYTFTLNKPLDHADGSAPHDVIDLNFGVTATDKDGDTATSILTVHVVDDAPVAHNDTNSFNSTVGAVETGNVITGLNGGAGAADAKSEDAPNTISKITFGGTTVNVPTAGTVTIEGDHGTLKIAADGSYTYAVKNTGTGNSAVDSFTYTLKDADGDTSTATLKLDGHVGGTTTTIVVTDNPPGTPGNPGHPTPPDTGFPGNDGHVTANGGDVLVKEDHSVNVGLAVNSTGSGQQVTTVVLSGIDASWGFVSHSGGTYNAAAGTWTITLAPGASLDGVFTFTPSHDSDVDLNNLHVTATTNDPATGRTSTATSDFNIVVDAVADVPVLNVSNAADQAGHSVALNINTHVADTDGSESITKVTIAGLPAGATLNHGTVSGGVWTLTVADLTGLTISVPKAVAKGDYALTVTSYNAESHLSGKEVDLTDNTNQATKTLTLHVTPNDVPWLTTPDAKVVDETDLSKGKVSVSDTLVASFGHDGPGTFGGTGAFTSSTPLFSNGVAVAVALVGGTYTGTANGHTIFTLAIQNDGHYTFNLLGTLDHPDHSNPNDAIALNFGVKATDADGDTDTSTLKVTVLDDGPVAHNDFNSFDAPVHNNTSGNVITGLNGGGTVAADTLSQDAPNQVTRVTHGAAGADVASTGTTTIHGDYGTLSIKADGSYTYKLDKDWQSKTAFEFNDTKEFPDLVSRHAITPAQQASLGLKDGVLDVSDDATISVKFVSSKAGYDNTLGVYSVNADGTLGNVEFIVKNGNDVPNAQASASLLSSAGQQSIGFFIIADGFAVNKGYAGLDLAHGSLSFIYDYGQGDARTAKVTDVGSHVSLVFTDATGHQTELQGPNYFTTERGESTSLNSDGSVRVVSGLAHAGDDSVLRIGFEDLPKLGDKDYDDMVFDVSVKLNSAHDNFQYTLTDGDGDASKATLTIGIDGNGGAGQTVLGTSAVDTLYGTSGNDTINGLGGGDILYGGHGTDIFAFSKISQGVDHIKDFSVAEGDTLDVSALLHGFDPVTDAINHFVFTTTNGGNTIVSVDPNGSGNAANATQVAVLEGVTGVSVEDLIHHAATS